MTLFEAIRELREGQAIVDSGEHSCREGIYYRWAWGREGIDEPGCQNYHDYSIIDLPKPKMSLEEGLEKAAFECLIGKRFDISTPTGYSWTANGIGYPTWSQAVAAAFASVLRSLPIDWQAEADRKEGEA